MFYPNDTGDIPVSLSLLVFWVRGGHACILKTEIPRQINEKAVNRLRQRHLIIETSYCYFVETDPILFYQRNNAKKPRKKMVICQYNLIGQLLSMEPLKLTKVFSLGCHLEGIGDVDRLEPYETLFKQAFPWHMV
ncbi:MAG: hypothetical protein ACTSW4_07605 [Candidatus Ranarchaeia archaeon]